MSDLGAPEVVVLATRNSKAWPMIVRRFRKSLQVASPPPGQQRCDEAEVLVSAFRWDDVSTSIEEER